jgi:hypothetical protein
MDDENTFYIIPTRQDWLPLTKPTQDQKQRYRSRSFGYAGGPAFTALALLIVNVTRR